ncbi:MAG: hypothetical protein R3F30_13010 [Planctomycetota bacterium]
MGTWIDPEEAKLASPLPSRGTSPVQRARTCRRDPAGERGFVLLIALFFVVLTAGMVFSGTLSLRSTEQKTELSLRTQGQARHFAEAGLVDALDWFRRQTSQPVATFAPKKDELATPPILDTDDPSIGLVRDFGIDRGIWGRYEVRRYVPNVSPAEPEVRDITAMRQASGTGAVWRLVSRAFIYERRDTATAFDVAPNKILASDVLETEIRRLTLVPPAQAAICSPTGSKIYLYTGAMVRGGTAAGLAYINGSGAPVYSGGKAAGVPAETQIASTNWFDDCQSVFGVDEDTLRSMADYQITYASEVPNPIPTNSIVFSDGSLYMSTTYPLKGTGILYVKGDVYVPYNTTSYFNGVIYATGNVYLYGPVAVNGTVIGKGYVYLSSLGDLSEVVYDDGVINSLMIAIGQYRFSSATYAHDLRGSLKIKKAD